MRPLLLAALAVIASGCAQAAFGTSMVNAGAIDAMQPALLIEAWTDEQESREKSAQWLEHTSSDDADLRGVVAPAWAYGGMRVRLARMVEGRRLGELELQVCPITAKELVAEAAADGRPLVSLGKVQSWQRFRLEHAPGTRVVVTVRCEVGDWVFRLPPAYFAGFAARAAQVERTALGR